jgi:hypothetical protein
MATEEQQPPQSAGSMDESLKRRFKGQPRREAPHETKHLHESTAPQSELTEDPGVELRGRSLRGDT